jgi:YegS/Rv2252/BmrU family lipid kinase
MKKKVRFIVNPVSGGKDKRSIPEQIRAFCEHTQLDSDVCFSSSVEETILQTKEAIERAYDAVVAVGGDGTINLIGAQLIGTSTALGIIPMGSGNGLARSLGIPFDIKVAVGVIDRMRTIAIDTGSVNGIPFLNVAGLGFDAHVAGQFQHSVKRGLITYAAITLREFNSYKPENIEITANGKTWESNAFLFTICNGPQFGSNAFIAPKALLSDGLFHVTQLKRCGWMDAPGLAIRLFKGTIDNDPRSESFTATSIQVKRKKAGLLNIDGEPVGQPEALQFLMHPLSLEVIIP